MRQVLADTDPVFTPSSVTASVGDSILFLFESGNHSVTQSTFDNPCERLSGGFDSGYEANIDNADATTPNYTISVTSSNSECKHTAKLISTITTPSQWCYDLRGENQYFR